MTIPEQLKAWRQVKGFTQAQAADHLKVSVRTYEGWEYGRHQPKGLALVTIQEKIQTSAPSKTRTPKK